MLWHLQQCCTSWHLHKERGRGREGERERERVLINAYHEVDHMHIPESVSLFTI